MLKNIVFALLLLPVSVAHAGFWDDYANKIKSNDNFSIMLDANTLSGKLATLKNLQETVTLSQKIIQRVCDVRFFRDLNNPYFYDDGYVVFPKSGDQLTDMLRDADRDLMYRKWTQVLPSWRAKVQQNIQTSFPGSNLDCASRSGTLIAGETSYIYSGGSLRKMIVNGQILAEIGVGHSTYTVIMTFGSEKCGFVMPISNPKNAYFVAFSTRVDASQSNTASETAETIVKNDDHYTRNLHSDSHAKKLDMMSKAMNSYYNTAFDAKGVTMIDFLKMFLTDPSFKNAVVAGYQETGGINININK